MPAINLLKKNQRTINQIKKLRREYRRLLKEKNNLSSTIPKYSRDLPYVEGQLSILKRNIIDLEKVLKK